MTETTILDLLRPHGEKKKALKRIVGEWKLTRIKRLAMEQGFPFVILCDGTGARLEEEVSSKAGYPFQKKGCDAYLIFWL